MDLQGTHKVLILIVFVRVSSSQKDCYRLNSRGGFDHFCCENHVRVHDDCVECESGTSSLNEQPCQPCSKGKYGMNCGHHCNCKINEKCESVGGCQLINDLITIDVKLTSLVSPVVTMHTVVYSRSNQHVSTVSVHNEKSTQVTMESPKSSVQPVSHTGPTLLQTSVLLTKNTNIKGLSAREVIVYSLGSAAFCIICIVMCVVLICYQRGRTRQLHAISTVHSEIQIHEEENSCYNSYESIDEDAIYDDNVLDDYSEYSENKYCKSESEGSTLNSEKSGYLLPFTSIIPNHGQEEHVYCRGVTSNTGNLLPLLDNEEKSVEHISSYEMLQKELIQPFKSEYTYLHSVHYLELIDIRKQQNNSNQSVTETFQKCNNPTAVGFKNNLRKFRKWYSNDNISDEQMLCITSKVKRKICRFYSEYNLSLTSETKTEIAISAT